MEKIFVQTINCINLGTITATGLLGVLYNFPYIVAVIVLSMVLTSTVIFYIKADEIFEAICVPFLYHFRKKRRNLMKFDKMTKVP